VKRRVVAKEEASMSRLVGVLTVVGLTALSVRVWAQERPWDWGGHPMWGMWGVWGMGMLVLMFLFWALVIIGLLAAIRWFVSAGREPRRDDALDILRQRYARGEINKEEFEGKRRDLG
jgi:putative membrane protein